MESAMNIFRSNRPRSNRSRLELEHLENRVVPAVLPPVLPVRCVPLGNGVFCSPGAMVSPTLASSSVLRTGGAAFQEGSVLHVDLSKPVGNEATLSDDGRGDVTVEWNGHTPPTFHGVRDIEIDSLGQHDTIWYNLTGNVTVAHEEIDVRLADLSSKFIPKLGAFQTKDLTFHVEAPHVSPELLTPLIPTQPDLGGAAQLVGSTLIVVTNHPGFNQAAIQDDGAGNVTVEWNGHTPPTFHGVSRIVIEALGQQNTIRYTLTGNVSKPHEVELHLLGNDTVTANVGGFETSGLDFNIAPPLVNLSIPPPPVNLAASAPAAKGP
jgi:hypothetical protein